MTVNRATPGPGLPPTMLEGIGGPPLEMPAWLPTAAWTTLLVVATLIPMTIGVEAALHFVGSAIDGPFQLYNALRRIAAGQRGGVDFQFFHGIGLPYLHYIPFRLMGGDFVASELTRQIVTVLAYPLALIVFFGTFTRDWRRTVALSAIVLVVSIALRLSIMLVAVNSLLGVRSTLATLVPVIWCMRIRPRLRAVLTGVALGGAILLGTEQGLAVVVAFTIVNAALVWRSGERRPLLIDGATTMGVMVLTIVIVTLAIGGISGLKGAMYYNLKLVPMDQYWYFGSPPNVFIKNWSSVLPMLADQPRILETILLALLFLALQIQRMWREPAGEAGRRHAALAILALYGLLTCASLLGIFLVGYVQPCIRVLLLIGALECDRLLRARDRTSWKALTAGRAMAAAAGAGIVAMMFTVPWVVPTIFTTLPHVVSDHIVSRRGMRWELMWPPTIVAGQNVIDARRGPNGKPPMIWSTYAGLIEARNGVFNPSQFDYIIHALGPRNRADYLERFRAERPTLVQTVMPMYSPWELWIEQTSWDFYGDLLRNYRVAGGTPWSIFWERLPVATAGPIPFWSTRLTAGARSVEVPSTVPGSRQRNAVLMQVEMEYRVRNPLGLLPVIGALPRYLVTPSGAIGDRPVTLDPYTTTTRFPMIVPEGSKLRLDFQTFSLLPGARLDVQAIRVSVVPITANNLAWFLNLIQAASPDPTPGH